MKASEISLECNSGRKYEKRILKYLQYFGFEGETTGYNDCGVDIIATIEVGNTTVTYNIQCKYYNKTVAKEPVHEVFSGSNFYNNNGIPVVITNNKMTNNALEFAKVQGVEVICEYEWAEVKKVEQNSKISQKYGLFGIIIGKILNDETYVHNAINNSKVEPKVPKEEIEFMEEVAREQWENKEKLRETKESQQKQGYILPIENNIKSGVGSVADKIENLLIELSTLNVDELELIKSKIEKMSENNKKQEDEISSCPYCDSKNLKKYGIKNGKQRYKCKECNKTFTKNTGKAKRYSKLTDEQWKGLVRGMVKNETLDVISEETGLSVPSVWFNRQKVCAMLTNTIESNDIFKDIAECDECFTPSAFKGKRDPSFFIDTLNRLPRHNRNYEEKVEYLRENGYGYLQESDPERWNKLLDDSKLRGISNEQVCTVTCKDRSGNLLIQQTCLGRLEIKDAKNVLNGKFAPDSILVTDCLSSYQKFARDEEIHLEQVNSKEHKKGPFSLAHVNALHSSMSSHWNRLDGRIQATKYHDFGLFFFWWLEKNKDLKINEKVDVLFKLVKTTNIENITYEDIRHKPLTLNTKGLIPEYV